MSKNNVRGQTGRGGLERIARLYFAKAELNVCRRREVRYMISGRKGMFRAYVTGPLHSRLYGVCGFGTTADKAVARLRHVLGNDYGFIGRLKRSYTDEAVGDNYRTLHAEPEGLAASRLSVRDAVGTAGM